MPAFQARSVRILGTHVDLWRPLVPDDNQTGGRDARKLRVVGRLADGVTIAQAETELAGIAARLAAIYPETNRDAGVRLVQLREQMVRDVRGGLILLLAAVGVVLLSACVNVANLLLVKAAAGRKAMAVQHALGASRGRIAAQVLTESLLLGAAGAGLGLLIGFGGVKAFIVLGPGNVPLLAEARIDGLVLAFTLLASVVTVLLVGLIPAWRSAHPEVTSVLRQGSNRTQSGGERRAMRWLTVASRLVSCWSHVADFARQFAACGAALLSTMSVSAVSPNGSLKLTGSPLAKPYKLSPPARPMGSSWVKVPIGSRRTPPGP